MPKKTIKEKQIIDVVNRLSLRISIAEKNLIELTEKLHELYTIIGVILGDAKKQEIENRKLKTTKKGKKNVRKSK